MGVDAPSPSPLRILVLVVVVLLILAFCIDKVALAFVEHPSWRAGGGTLHALAGYLTVRHFFLSWWPVFLFLGVAVCSAIYFGLKRLAAWGHRLRTAAAGMGEEAAVHALQRVPFSLKQQIISNPSPNTQVVLGVDAKGSPVYVTDRQRSMHMHIIGQTGTGKTKSVLEPLIFQDLRRRRGVVMVDAKGSDDNERRLIAMANVCGRLDNLRVFTLNRFRTSHTYNPVHLVSDGDPRAVAERVFSSFVDDMDNPYYRDQSRKFFLKLVEALAGTGKPFIMKDLSAAISSPAILHHALKLSSDGDAKAQIIAQLNQLGKKAGETFTGLQAAVDRYDHAALNSVDPDIVLEDAVDSGAVTAFFLPVNMYKQLARYTGVCVFQHLQQVGALRQLDRSRPQTPVYIYADEFYSFAYEGFTDAVNKLRDANMAFHLAHQSYSDLEKVSPEYATGIYDNTRTKVIMYQNDADFVERFAKSLGTSQTIKRTTRETVDGFLNTYSTLEASSRAVDEYRLHPNKIKALECGQAYMAHDSFFAGVNFQTIPEAFFDGMADVKARPPKVPAVQGLGLHALFLKLSPPTGD